MADRGSHQQRASRWLGLVLAAGLAVLLVACGQATVQSVPVRQVSAASCAGLSASAQFADAKVVFSATMLPGPSVAAGHRQVLASPARARVLRYLKGRGSKIVTVSTAVSRHGSSIQVTEDGIEPVAGERWKIYSSSKRPPYQTSTCGGSKRTGPIPSARSAEPAACPARPQHTVPRNAWPQARSQLAPTGVDAMRLCRYSSSNAHPPAKLVRARLVTDRALVGIHVAQFNRLPPFPPGAIACPMDDGSQILALLAYANGKRVKIRIDLSGCQGVTNGDLLRIAAGFGMPRQFGPQLLRALERLTQVPGVPR